MTASKSWLGGIVDYFTHNKPEPIEVEGHTFPGRTKLGKHELVLNGAGVRSLGEKKIYAIALYLPEKTKRLDTARALLGARRAQLIILSPLNAAEFIGSLKEGIANNTDETNQAFITKELEQIEDFMHDLSNLAPNDVVNVDWIPSRGTFVYYNGQLMGNPVRGKALYDAILSIWLGSNALEDQLRNRLMDRQ